MPKMAAASDNAATTAVVKAQQSSPVAASTRQSSRHHSSFQPSPNLREGTTTASAVRHQRSARASKSAHLASTANLTMSRTATSHPTDNARLSNQPKAHPWRDTFANRLRLQDARGPGAALSSGVSSKQPTPVLKPRSPGSTSRTSTRKGQRSTSPGTAARRKKARAKLLERVILTAVMVCAGAMLTVAVIIIVRSHYRDDPKIKLETCKTPGCRKHAYDLALAIDPKVEPCEDFYAHTCGKWHRLHRLSFRYNLLLSAMRRTVIDLKKEVSAGAKLGSVAAFYESCMNPKGSNRSASVERFAAWKRSLGLLWPEQHQEATKHPLDVLLALALRWNINLLFAVRLWASRQPRTATIFLDRGTLWDYMRHRRKAEKLWGSYKGYVAAHCSLLNAETNTHNMTALRESEDALYDVAEKAKYAPTSTQVWFPLHAFEGYMPSVNADLWHQLLSKHLNSSRILVNANDTIIAHSSILLAGLDKLFAAYASRIERLLEGIAWIFVERYLWAAGETPSLRFGTGDLMVEEKIAACIFHVDSRLGVRSMATYIRERFNASVRIGLHVFLEKVVHILQESLEGLSWIDPNAAAEAKLKLTNLTLDVFPTDVLFEPDGIDYLYHNFTTVKEGVQVMSFIDYFLKYSGVLRKYLGSDRYEGVYHRRHADAATPLVEYLYYPNSLRVSLVSLEPPLYSPDGTFAMNFGGLGAFVARELSHSFDDAGVLVDSEGSARTWWGSTLSAGYKKKLLCHLGSSGKAKGNRSSLLEEHAQQLGLFPHVPALEASYRAYKHAVSSASSVSGIVDVVHLPHLEDYSDDQLFFLTFCHAMCTPQENTDAAKLCNVPLRNFRSFAEAFHCPVGSPMNPVNKCTFFES